MTKRFRELIPDHLTAAQQPVFEAIASGPRQTVPYIYHLLLRSPELAKTAQALGVFCRYGTQFSPRLSELAILVVARHWDAAYEWSVHVHEARKAGVPEPVIAALEKDEVPVFDDADDDLVYRFASSYFANNDVSDDLFAAAQARFGEQAVVELAGLLGYYSMLAICLRIYRVPPQGEA
ncbi:carboxymuconolactone decarboxylase family protein [Aquabacter cavernae]|uniref:carboxymuconolactone decarboxylase family protein n=1 Tax=Aquabacter cavernae TaxID=2496029 RepID=UPI000F8DB577|nr:carboxymuconolactone decarboxylase family protein [Aquabacter cavernae]